MTVSIIICTRNRAESLKATLFSIGNSLVPKGWHVDLLVVDNGSTDSTKDVVGRIQLPNISVRLISEPSAGQCHARNAGLLHTTGEAILFTDDDIRVPLNWIGGMCSPILCNGADAVAGGVVFSDEIALALSRPPLSSLRGWFASTESLDPNTPDRMVGANMAFHRRVLEKVPQFDIELGPGALGFNDETLFSSQLLSAGFRITGAIDVAVEHHFDINRLAKINVLDSARKMGRSNAFLFHHWAHKELGQLQLRLTLSFLDRLKFKGLALVAAEKRANVSGEEIYSERRLAFYHEYIKQRRRKRKYPSRSPITR
jgi:glycosyltransferase involved in cell wall biosynthesis